MNPAERGRKPSLVDSHCHLLDRRFDEDREAVIAAAHAAGVSHMVAVGTDHADNPGYLRLAERTPSIAVAVGIHPHEAASVDEALWKDLEEWAGHPSVAAVGESGLDYHYMHSPAERQQEVFLRHIDLARRLDLPLVVHSRDAQEDTLAILREHGRGLRGVLHCFSGDHAMARAALEMGFFVSVAGPVTFRKAGALRDVLREVPVERLLVETDAPYLAPEPRRGRRNEPALLVHTARALAELKGLSFDDVARITTLNAHRLFGIGAPDESGRIAYPIRDALYLNITNRCTNRCGFCVRHRDAFVKGHNLRLDAEPSTAEIIEAVGDPRGWSEVVFCGYGEPLIRLETVVEVADWLKRRQARVRVNTNGQADLVHGRDVAGILAGRVDAYSISLNAATEEDYNRICRPDDPRAWKAMLAFARSAAARGAEVSLTAVELPGLDVEGCRRLAAELGVRFRLRALNVLG